MEKINVLYNPLAGNGNGENFSRTIKEFYDGKKIEYVDMTSLNNYSDFFSSLDEDEKIIVAGGDGTLHRFVNETYGLTYKNELYYFAAGSGNDFLADLNLKKGCAPFRLEKYIEKLPQATINGKTYRFINNMSFGIDGYCCEEGDILRQKSSKPVNYAGIAIKGLIYKFKPANAKVTIDGVCEEFEKVWLAPAMNGRFCGGGLMLAPNQDRLEEDRHLSFLTMHGAGRFKTLTMFPSVFSGTQEKYKKHVKIVKAKRISVEFDRPMAAQIDGETILNVTKYEACTYDCVKDNEKETATAK